MVKQHCLPAVLVNFMFLRSEAGSSLYTAPKSAATKENVGVFPSMSSIQTNKRGAACSQKGSNLVI